MITKDQIYVGARVRCLRSYCDDLTGEVLAVNDGTLTVHWDDDDPALNYVVDVNGGLVGWELMPPDAIHGGGLAN